MSTSFSLKRSFLVVVVLAVVASGGVMFTITRHDARAQTAEPGAKTDQYVDAIGPVAAAAKRAADGIGKQKVEAVPQNLTLRLTGSLIADEKSEVGSNAAGIVSETRVNRGSFVKKNDLLVQLDPRDAQYALDEALAAVEELRARLGLDEHKEIRIEEIPEVEAAKLALDLAERTYKRSEALKQQNAVALESWDQAVTDYRSAVQRYQLAMRMARQMYRSYISAKTHVITLRKAVDDCSIRAPFDGWVAERNISVGERVISLFPGAKLVTLLRIDPLRLSLTVPQQEMAQIKVGQTVVFQTDAFPGKTFNGTVRYITPAVTSDNRSLCVEAVVPNPDAMLRPGLFATAELQLDQQRTDLFVPKAAVLNRGEVAAVFVVRGGVIREQIVSVGESAGGRVHVTSGLAPGDIVITTPNKVRDGDPES
jgi:RND family efflux transporter MFP subunit